MARLLLTEERGGRVTVRLHIKPVDAQWHVMHVIDTTVLRNAGEPLQSMEDVVVAMQTYLDGLTLPYRP